MSEILPEVIAEGYPVSFPLPFCTTVLITEGEFKGSRAYETPSTCYEAKDPTIIESLDSIILYAEGIHDIHETDYLDEVHSLSQAFMNYDEPVFPIPVGTSCFYVIMIAWLTSFYFTHFTRKFLRKKMKNLDLFPDPIRFPDVPLYWLQETKKETELRREVRNTWAWLARRYLLSPNDPLLSNVDQVLGHVNWNDFDVSRNTQSLINCILQHNSLFLKVKKDKATGKREFEVLMDSDLTYVPMEGDQVKRIFEEINHDEVKAAEVLSVSEKVATSSPRTSGEKLPEEGQRPPEALKTLQKKAIIWGKISRSLQSSRITKKRKSKTKEPVEGAAGKKAGKSAYTLASKRTSRTKVISKHRLSVKGKKKSKIATTTTEEENVLPEQMETDIVPGHHDLDHHHDDKKKKKKVKHHKGHPDKPNEETEQPTEGTAAAADTTTPMTEDYAVSNEKRKSKNAAQSKRGRKDSDQSKKTREDDPQPKRKTQDTMNSENKAADDSATAEEQELRYNPAELNWDSIRKGDNLKKKY